MNSDKKDALGFIMERIGFGCQYGFEDCYSNLDFQIDMCDELKKIQFLRKRC